MILQIASVRSNRKSLTGLCLGVAAIALIAGAGNPASAQQRRDLGIPADSREAQEEMPIPEFEERERETPEREDRRTERRNDDVLKPVNPAAQDMPPDTDLETPNGRRENRTAKKPSPLLPEGRKSLESSYDEDVFYDSGDLVPKGELGRRAPRKVNPKLEPASKLIVVKKDSGPNSSQARLVSASRAMTLGRYESALDIYQGLYEKNPKNTAVLMGVAVALQRMGNADAAIAAYDELLELEPENVNAEVNMLGLLSEKYPQVALHRLTELRSDSPENLGVVAQLAVTHAQMNNIEDAIKYLGIAASMEPKNPSHVFNMAVIADRAGKKKQAVKFYEQALEVDSIYAGGRSLPRDVVFERLARLR